MCKFLRLLTGLFILIGNFKLSYAQNKQVVQGTIRDKISGESLPGAIVTLNDSIAALSNGSGNYRIETKPSLHLLKVKLLGYADYEQTILLQQPDTLVVDVFLQSANKALDEVVIAAGKFEQKVSDLTVSVEVIKPSLIENKAVVAVDQIMNQVPGVNVTDSQVSIRGGSGFSYGAGSRVLLLVDELPMISADAGDIKWNYLPLENLEQIEVVKGASSALFGSSALNGVINLRTAYPKEKTITSINSIYAIYNNPQRASLVWWHGRKNPEYRSTSFSHLQKIGKLDLVIAGNFYDNDGFRLLESETRARGNVNLKYNFSKLPGLALGLNCNYMNVKGGNFFLWQNDSLAYNPKDNKLQQYDNNRFNLDPFLVYNTEKTGRHSLRTRMFRTNNQNDKNQNAKADLYYAEYQWQKRFKNEFTFTSGIVYLNQIINSDSLYGEHKGYNRALYVQADKKIKKITFSFGLRGEYFKVDTATTKGSWLNNKKGQLPFQPVMRAGVNYQLLDFTFLRCSFGQGYRFPTVAEKYIKTYVGSLNIFPNLNLQPERGWSTELAIKQGFRIANFKGFIDVAGFWTEYQNMMDFVFIYDTVGLGSGVLLFDLLKHSGFQSQNIGNARITGTEISINGTGRIGKLNFTLLGGYTYTNPINPNFDASKDFSGSLPGSNLLKYRSKHLVKNDIQIDYKKMSIGYSIRYSSYVQNIDKRFEEPLIYDIIGANSPGFYNNPALYVLPGLKKYRQTHNKGDWMSDFRMAYQLSNSLKISFLINNLFNHEYMSRPGYIEAPRSVIIQFGFKF